MARFSRPTEIVLRPHVERDSLVVADEGYKKEYLGFAHTYYSHPALTASQSSHKVSYLKHLNLFSPSLSAVSGAL